MGHGHPMSRARRTAALTRPHSLPQRRLRPPANTGARVPGARSIATATPEEKDSDPTAQSSKRRCCEIHKCRVPAWREVLEIFQNAGIQPETADDPGGASVQSIACHRDRRRAGISDDVLNLARKIGSY